MDDIFNIGKIHDTIKSGFQKGRKTIEDGLSQIENRLTKITRNGNLGNKNAIDLKVIKNKAPPRPPEPRSPVLRPGPPYNDQTLIQKFITDELEREERWPARQHGKPVAALQGRFRRPNEVEDDGQEDWRVPDKVEPPMPKSFPPPPPPPPPPQPVKASKEVTTSKGGVFRNFISNLVQKSILEGSKRQEEEVDRSGEITIDMFTTTTTEEQEHEVSTPLYFPATDSTHDEDEEDIEFNEVIEKPALDPFRFNQTPRPDPDHYTVTYPDHPKHPDPYPDHPDPYPDPYPDPGIVKVGKPGSSGWQRIHMDDMRVDVEYKHDNNNNFNIHSNKFSFHLLHNAFLLRQ